MAHLAEQLQSAEQARDSLAESSKAGQGLESKLEASQAEVSQLTACLEEQQQVRRPTCFSK